jgi:hypothetical protein
MITVEQIERFYSYFYSKKYSDNNKFKPTKATTSVCNSFLQIVDKKYSLHCVGETFLWEYFLFQFQYWHDLIPENIFSDKIMFKWIVGKKAFERWENRDREFDWFIENYPIINLYGVQKKDLFTFHEQQIKVNTKKRFDASKRIRKEYLNTEKGFAICIEMTSLFDPSDTSCIKCQNRVDCKELLRVNYPSLYNQRIN